MFVFVKGKIKTFNGIRITAVKGGTMRRTAKLTANSSASLGDTKARHSRTNNKSWVILDKKLKGNVWEYAVGSGVSNDPIAFQHPAIFPERLAEDHIYSWSNENDLVFDPFTGSGTVAVSCKKLNRNFIGSEINPDYVAIANQRLANVQDGLF